MTRKKFSFVNLKVSKEVKDAEKLVMKQTDKTEVNKYIYCMMDPLVVSSPPGELYPIHFLVIT